MAANPNTFTADEVLDLPVPEGAIGYEFVDGRPVPVMPASPLHGELIIEIGCRLRPDVEEAGLPGKVWSDVGFVPGLPRDREETGRAPANSGEEGLVRMCRPMTVAGASPSSAGSPARPPPPRSGRRHP